MLKKEIQTNVGKSHSAAPEVKRCFPRWDARHRPGAQVPGTVDASGCACAPPFFLQKAFRSAVGAQPTRHVCCLLFVYSVVLLYRKNENLVRLFFLGYIFEIEMACILRFYFSEKSVVGL